MYTILTCGGTAKFILLAPKSRNRAFNTCLVFTFSPTTHEHVFWTLSLQLCLHKPTVRTSSLSNLSPYCARGSVPSGCQPEWLLCVFLSSSSYSRTHAYHATDLEFNFALLFRWHRFMRAWSESRLPFAIQPMNWLLSLLVSSTRLPPSVPLASRKMMELQILQRSWKSWTWTK